MKNKIVFIILILILIVAGSYIFLSFNNASKINLSENDQPDNNQILNQDKSSSNQANSESLIAGNITQYKEFNKEDYQKALDENKIIFLNFYANWCPICRSEIPDINTAFDEMQFPEVVGFRVNYNDNETDADEKALAQKFEIPYQHTKVILINGNEVFQETKQWTKEEVIKNISKFRN